MISEGRLVKGIKFNSFKDAGLPHTTARAHGAQGIDELMLLDINATRTGENPDFKTLTKVAESTMTPITFGGGINNLELARECMNCGADKIMITSALLESFDSIVKISQVYGNQAVVSGIDISIDNNGEYKLYNHVQKSLLDSPDPIEMAVESVNNGSGEIRFMFVDKEGTRAGVDLDFVNLARKYISVPILIEGGVGKLDDIKDALLSGADGICLGTFLVFSDNNIVKIKRYLKTENINIRNS